jgi:hypothetical protein
MGVQIDDVAHHPAISATASKQHVPSSRADPRPSAADDRFTDFTTPTVVLMPGVARLGVVPRTHRCGFRADPSREGFGRASLTDSPRLIAMWWCYGRMETT